MPRHRPYTRTQQQDRFQGPIHQHMHKQYNQLNHQRRTQARASRQAHNQRRGMPIGHDTVKPRDRSQPSRLPNHITYRRTNTTTYHEHTITHHTSTWSLNTYPQAAMSTKTYTEIRGLTNRISCHRCNRIHTILHQP